MIVQYARERGFEGEGKDPHLTLGRTYVVFGIEIRSDGYPNEITIRCDSDGDPALFDYSFFDVIDPDLPDGWCFNHLSEDYQRLCPKEFSADFWDRFHDGDPEAEAIFDRVAQNIEAFHAST